MSLSDLLKASPSTRRKAQAVLDSLEAIDQHLNFASLSPQEAFRHVESLELNTADASRIKQELAALIPDGREEQLPLDSTAVATPEDGLLADLNELKLFGIVSPLLGINYLSPYDEAHSSPYSFKDWKEGAKGIVWGPLRRTMLTIPVAYTNTVTGEKNTINVHFVADSGGPTTKLSATVFRELLRVSDDTFTPEAIFVKIGGVRHGVSKCSPTGNHADIPLLGVDFMQKIRGRFVADFDTENVTLVGRV